MHELFLSAHVAPEDLQRSLRILQGYCGMSPVALLRRRLIWEGPRMRTPKGMDLAFIKRQPQLTQPVWNSLNEQIKRQSYIITLIYDVEREQFGQTATQSSGSEGEDPTKEEAILDCDQLPGTLRWSDVPDPGGARPVNSRLMLNIEHEKGLCTSLRAINHRFAKEMVQECYRFVNGNVLFELSRYLQFPPDETHSLATIRTLLPAFDTLTPFDSEDKWVLTASVVVSNGNNPEQMQRGTDDLMALKTDFEGCYDFQALDRLTFDTRVKF